jgi:hypothetical protein
MPWAWAAAIALSVLWGIGQLLDALTGHGRALVGLAVSALVVWYLLRGEVQGYFGRA